MNVNIAQFQDSVFAVSDDYQEKQFLSVEAISESSLRVLNPTAYF